MFGEAFEVVTIDLLNGLFLKSYGAPGNGWFRRRPESSSHERRCVNSLTLFRLAGFSDWFAERRAAVLHIMHA
jgi:hypothetical protein